MTVGETIVFLEFPSTPFQDIYNLELFYGSACGHCDAARR
jgi:hypothetical protein